MIELLPSLKLTAKGAENGPTPRGKDRLPPIFSGKLLVSGTLLLREEILHHCILDYLSTGAGFLKINNMFQQHVFFGGGGTHTCEVRLLAWCSMISLILDINSLSRLSITCFVSGKLDLNIFLATATLNKCTGTVQEKICLWFLFPFFICQVSSSSFLFLSRVCQQK